jgi:hypothetical protein
MALDSLRLAASGSIAFLVVVGLGLAWYSMRARRSAPWSLRSSQHTLRDDLKAAIHGHDLRGVAACLDRVDGIPESERLPALIYDFEGLRSLFDKRSAKDAPDNLDQAARVFDLSERILQVFFDRAIPVGDSYCAIFAWKTIREIAQSQLQYMNPSIAGDAFTARLTAAAAKPRSAADQAAIASNAKRLGKTFVVVY